MRIKRLKAVLLLTLMMTIILILAISSTKDSIMIAAISQADDNTWDSNSCMLAGSPNTIWITPIDDASVTRGFPDNKRGVEEPWHMWTSSCAGVPHSGYYLTERSFLKFDLSTIPSLGNSHVRLYAYCYKTDAAPNGDIECCYVDNDNWSENTITWNTQPVLGDVLDTHTVTEAKRWYCWDVTSFVENELTGDNIASFCLKTPMEYNEYPHYYFYGWWTKESWEDWACPYLVIGYNVGIQVSPDYREGLAGGTLSYNVNVINKGSLSDDYSLTVSDDAGWSLMLSENSLESIQPGGKRTVMLSVIIPENAELCTEDNIFVTVVSQADNGASDSSACIVHVSKKINPPCEDLTVVTGDPTVGNWSTFWVGRYHNSPEHGWLKFDLQAIPTNFNIHSAKLYLYCWNVDSANVRVHRADNDDWRENETNCWNEPSFGAAISSSQLVDEVGWYSWDVTSYVKSEFMDDKIVSFCLVDLEENTPPDHAAGFESKEWSNKDQWPYLEILAPAHLGMGTFELENLYAVRLEKNLYLNNGLKLVVKFYRYDNTTLQTEIVTDNFEPPENIKENENVPHPRWAEGYPWGTVQIAKLVLTTDDTAEVISTIASFTVHQSDLRERLIEILTDWFAHPELQDEFRAEIIDILLQWFSAPA